MRLNPWAPKRLDKPYRIILFYKKYLSFYLLLALLPALLLSKRGLLKRQISFC